MSEVRENILRVRERIAAAAARAGRDPAGVRLMGVTKTVGDDRIRQAIEAGIDIIGENYVQEARRKIELMGKSVEWHFIGHLQTNKAKYAVRLFDMIHSVNRVSLAEELNRRAAAAGVVCRVLIEVNLAGEESKSGASPEEAPGLIRTIAAGMPSLSIQGLMTMAPWYDDPERARPCFAGLRMLRDRIAAENIPNVTLRELSMGMTDDFEVAVEEGATIVRIGRAIFGERTR
ncbi:MAG TPA: YggS family pyridoxal phosphate-dependent enzyme [Syntrophales bacterium]|nr:YggS family pyridoxal phosphate-dependent enzyme [Syntrophales bacterium]